MRAFFVFSLILFSFSTLAGDIVFKLSKSENIRILQKEILELAETLPAGTMLSVPGGFSPETHLYRTSSGKVERSSNGFFSGVKIVTSDLHPERVLELNKQDLWISVGSVPLQIGANFPALDLNEPKNEYLLSFEESGRPKFNLSSYYRTRFPKSLNRAIASSEMSEGEMRKWQTIMKELAVAGDRSVKTKSMFLFIPENEAMEASTAYEDKDEVTDMGAWTIAVKATAVRHGFPNVPCAEFMSEMLKQAYMRAGYNVFDDFNEANGTRLSWNKTSAVINLTNTLYTVGWIPWELAYYRPPTGAIMAHFKATTPGHVYMSAGLDGRLIMDNGSPAGRKLYETSNKTIKMMYYGGVFFIPPGIIPSKW